MNFLIAWIFLTLNAQAQTNLQPLGWNHLKSEKTVRMIQVSLYDQEQKPLNSVPVQLLCGLNSGTSYSSDRIADLLVQGAPLELRTSVRGVVRFRKDVSQSETCLLIHKGKLVRRLDFWKTEPNQVSKLVIRKTIGETATKIELEKPIKLRAYFYIKGKRKKAKGKKVHLTCHSVNKKGIAVYRETQKTDKVSASVLFKKIPLQSECFVQFEMSPESKPILALLNMRDQDGSQITKAVLHINIPGEGDGEGSGTDDGTNVDVATVEPTTCPDVCIEPKAPEMIQSKVFELDLIEVKNENEEWIQNKIAEFSMRPIELRFPQNGHIISDEVPDLNEIVELMNLDARIQVSIEGYTNSDQSEAYNFELSKKRCEAVHAYLTSNGIEDARIVVTPYGESKLILNADGTEDKIASRRTMVIPRLVGEK
jgi:outer membrane protein OmpA-like peptidoglycan-associated protein